MKALILTLVLSLWPMSILAQAGLISVATGVTGSHSAAMVVSDAATQSILAEARVLRHGAYEAFIVELGQRYDGGGALQMSAVTQTGRPLDFEPAWRTEPFCSGMGVCSGHRLGTIFLSRDAFEAGARGGMDVDMFGPGGRFDLTLPAELFAQARVRAVWLD